MAADYSGELSIGRSCLCFTQWSRPCQAQFLTSQSPPVLQIEKRGGKVKQVSLADAALCPKPTTSCHCLGNRNKEIVMKLPDGKRLLLKATSAEEREEWRVRLEAAMLLPLLEEKGISASSLSAAAVEVEDKKEEVVDDIKVFDGKVEVANREERQGEGGQPIKPVDVYALSEGHTTWERVNDTPEGSALTSECAKKDSDAALLSKNKSCGVNILDGEEEAPLENSEITAAKYTEEFLDGVPSWLGLIRRSKVLEPDMMSFDYEEMFVEAADMEENIVPRRSALINSILRQLIQTMNPSKVPNPMYTILKLESFKTSIGN